MPVAIHPRRSGPRCGPATGPRPTPRRRSERRGPTGHATGTAVHWLISNTPRGAAIGCVAGPASEPRAAKTLSNTRTGAYTPAHVAGFAWWCFMGVGASQAKQALPYIRRRLPLETPLTAGGCAGERGCGDAPLKSGPSPSLIMRVRTGPWRPPGAGKRYKRR